MDDKEAEFVSKVEKRYRRYVIEGEIHDHDMVRLNPRWEIASYEPLELWPVPPGDILEFWNYLAYAFYKKKLPYADFMECSHRSRRMFSAGCTIGSRSARWRLGMTGSKVSMTVHPRKFLTRLSSGFSPRSTKPGSKPVKRETEEWASLREKGEIERILKLFDAAALRMDAASRILVGTLPALLREEWETYLDLEQEEACRFMNLLFHQKELAGYLVNLDERPFKRGRRTAELAL